LKRTLLVLVVLLAAVFVRTASAADGPVIASLACVSSVGVATLSDVMPASTQVVQLSAAAYDTVRCEVVVSGTYTSLQWRGPNDDYGAAPAFATAVGGPRYGGAPYDIALTVNWGGNPLMAHISVLPDARAQVVTITAQPGCFILPPVSTIVAPTLGCPLPGVPSVGTSSITVGY
jgi:hypothetical protein